MAANNELSELEQRIIDYLKRVGSAEDWMITNWLSSRYRPPVTRAAIASLISKGMIIGSAEQPIRYKCVGGDL